MPHNQAYEDITQTCEGCGRTVVAIQIEVSNWLLRTVLRCLNCEINRSAYYLFQERRYANQQFQPGDITRSVSWACEHGCQWLSHANRIEVSQSYLRMFFKCRVCRGTAIRYYDLEHHGYVDVTGRVVPLVFPYNRENSKNRTRHLAVKECESMVTCPRSQVRALANLVKIGVAPHRVHGVVAAVAENCPCMDDRQVRDCYTRLFARYPVGGPFSLKQERGEGDDSNMEFFQRAYRNATSGEIA